MELLSAIESRRSIRKFKSDEVPEKYITELIDAGRLAPSGTNLQPTRYVVIKSEDTRKKLNECTPLPFVGAAPVVIAVCVDNQSIVKTGDRMKELREAQAFVGTPLDDVDPSADAKKGGNMDEFAIKAYLNLNAAIAIDHITLRAVDLGLGTCWVMMFDQEKVKNLLGLDQRHDVVALIPVGYPDQSPSQRPRLDMDEVLIKEI
jgi:nitroreductase